MELVLIQSVLAFFGDLCNLQKSCPNSGNMTKTVQTVYNFNDVNHINILIELVFQIGFKKW